MGSSILVGYCYAGILVFQFKHSSTYLRVSTFSCLLGLVAWRRFRLSFLSFSLFCTVATDIRFTISFFCSLSRCQTRCYYTHSVPQTHHCLLQALLWFGYIFQDCATQFVAWCFPARDVSAFILRFHSYLAVSIGPQETREKHGNTAKVCASWKYAPLLKKRIHCLRSVGRKAVYQPPSAFLLFNVRRCPDMLTILWTEVFVPSKHWYGYVMSHTSHIVLGRSFSRLASSCARSYSMGVLS